MNADPFKPRKAFELQWPGCGRKFTQVPSALWVHWRELGLKPIDRDLICAFLELQPGPAPVVETTYKTLTALTGHSAHTLLQSVRRLEQFDYLEVAKAHKQPNTYRWAGLIEHLAEEVRRSGISCVADLHRNGVRCIAKPVVIEEPRRRGTPTTSHSTAASSYPANSRIGAELQRTGEAAAP